MRLRKATLGDKNLVGARVEQLRKKTGMKQKELLAQMQVYGIGINGSALSKIEGQTRIVTDAELLALAEIFNTTADFLLGREDK